MEYFKEAFLTGFAEALSEQLGPTAEVQYHAVRDGAPEGSYILISQNQVRKPPLSCEVPYRIQELFANEKDEITDNPGSIEQTDDGSLIKESMVCVRNRDGQLTGILEIRNDLTLINALQETLQVMTGESGAAGRNSVDSHIHVNDLLEDYIKESIHRTGKPVALMTREDKMNAIRYLYDTGALLITKSGPRICECFHISKFTLYSYLDEIKSQEQN